MTEYFDSIAKRIANILLTLAVSFALFACADIGERDNPVDPGYKGAREDDALSSSSSWSLAIGSMTDSRDGQVYKTVTIGTQTWMAENLNYDPGDVSGMGSYAWSGCYDNQRKNCSKYGRLYTWEVAMNNAACGIGMTCDPSGVVQGVCPEGWHLPSIDEWNALFTAVGGISTAGTMLKSTSGWSSNGNGTGAFGFSALPAGDRDDNGNFDSMGYYAFFWSSTERYGDYAYYMDLYYHYESAFLDLIYKYYAWSVRCLQDSDEGSGATSSSSQAQPSSSMTDSRDGQVYKTVTIGTQTWMAENLNYNTSGSYCYGDNAGNCSKYGRLYEWSAAMDACPTGWHLPSDEEWNTLWDAVGGTNTAGRSLKSTSGWYDNGNGTDSFGFAVLPAGRRYYDGDFDGEGYRAYFWSSTELSSNDADNWNFYSGRDDVYNDWYYKGYAFSVRCLRD